MDKPLISVICAIYNSEKYIEKSLNSIINQTFRDFEIIVYDDCSIDNSVEIVKDIIEKNKKDIKIKLLLGKENLGCGGARHQAIEYSQGKYIAIQDSDDISFANRFQNEIDILEKNENIFCVGGLAKVIDENGNFLENFSYPPEENKDIYDFMLSSKNPIIDPSCMFRRDIYDSLDGYSKEKQFNLIPDFYLWARAAVNNFEFYNIQDYLVYYRKHSNSITSIYKREAIRQHLSMYKEYICVNKDKILKVF